MIYLILRMSPLESLTPQKTFQNNAGQAMLEYILILVVTVTLLLSLMTQIFKPLQSFLKAYMGDYIQCILETGELPALGGETRITDESDGCNARFEAATLAAGRPPRDSERSSAAAASGRDSRRERSSGGGAGGGSTVGRSSNFGSSRPPRSASSERGGAGSTKVVEISLGSTGEAGFFKKPTSSAYSNNSAQQPKTVVVYGVSNSDDYKEKPSGPSAPRVVAGGLTPEAAKKIPVKPPPKPGVEEEAAPWSFGEYLRYFLIALILIAFILLIGGQAFRLAKSWEK